MTGLNASRWLPLAPLAAAAVGVVAAGPRAQGLLANTALVAAGTLALALPIGVLLAVLIHKTRLPGRGGASVALLAMIFVPLHLHAAAWRAGFGVLGWWTQFGAAEGPTHVLLDGTAGAVWVHAMAATAWVTLIVGAALAAVDPRVEEDALLMMPAWRVLGSVSFRWVAPALLLAAGWVVVTVAHEMTVTDLFQVRTFAEEVYTQHALGLFDPAQLDDPAQRLEAGQLGAGLLVVWCVAVALLWAARPLAEGIAAGITRDAWRCPVRWRAGGAALLAGLVLLLAGLPVGNLATKVGVYATREGDAWRRDWSAAKAVERVAAAPVEHRRQLWQSAKLGLGVACGATLLGALVAWRLARGGFEQLAWLAFIAFLLTTPGPLIGIGAIWVFNQPRDSPLSFLSWLYDNTLLVAWAVQMTRAAPLVALVLWPVWRSLPTGLTDAARLESGPLGAAWAAVRARRSAVTAAWMVALAVSCAELSATLLVLPPGPQTVTIELFNMLHSGVDDRVAAISLWLVALFALLAWAISRCWTRDAARTGD
ncbi:hypothetical protein Pla123a_14660 [Posidoniimonas polymericola]|uniref:ABC transmembrane type-1 domain-containing protein n=1 Tax=Posidoniimonas polymericola TaxID=2528002 RepID=A0A5C5YSD9_9BACT|nr:iron ABC transporter permease [Posidoniimonas polymericola]TWT77670.1 hypothetical protein Pla123a_14660 [Posidoniimonas polymericola]